MPRRNLFSVCGAADCTYAVFNADDLQGACPVSTFLSYVDA
jgi:hypothetical protein